MKELDLTREQLYELVWEKPLAHIIKTYGGTYKEIKEMLEKYNIPIPENGYWSRIRAGYNIPKSPLPRIDEAEKIVYHPREKKKRIKIEEKPTTTQKYDQVVQTMDKLVLKAKKSYQKAIKGRRDDILIRISYESLDVNVSPKMVDRALDFFNSLIIRVKHMGGTIKIAPHTTSVIYSGEKIVISLREKQNRVMKENTGYSWNSYEYHPSGILYFKVGESSWDSKEWKDTTYTIIEDKIDEILEHLRKTAVSIKEHRIEQERYRVEQEKKRLQQVEFEKRQSVELANFVQLKINAELWEKANIIRSYLSALEETARKQERYDSEMQQYLEWAKKKVDWYDPLIDAQDELLEEINKKTLAPIKKGFW